MLMGDCLALLQDGNFLAQLFWFNVPEKQAETRSITSYVCLVIFQQNYAKSTDVICSKLDGGMGHGPEKNP